MGVHRPVTTRRHVSQLTQEPPKHLEFEDTVGCRMIRRRVVARKLLIPQASPVTMAFIFLCGDTVGGEYLACSWMDGRREQPSLLSGIRYLIRPAPLRPAVIRQLAKLILWTEFPQFRLEPLPHRPSRRARTPWPAFSRRWATMEMPYAIELLSSLQ